MHKQTLQSLLHFYFPEWDESIMENREKLGFSFNLRGKESWDLFAEGKHLQVRDCASQEITSLGLPDELAEYWVCCFYSDYYRINGVINLPELKGPPFQELCCPASFLGKEWEKSINKTRAEFMSKYGLVEEKDLER